VTGVGYALGWSRFCRVTESWAAWASGSRPDIAWAGRALSVRVARGHLHCACSGDRRPTVPSCGAMAREAMRSYRPVLAGDLRCRSCPRNCWSRNGRGTATSRDARSPRGRERRSVIPRAPHGLTGDQAAAWVIGARGRTTHDCDERLERTRSMSGDFLAFRQELALRCCRRPGGPSHGRRSGPAACAAADGPCCRRSRSLFVTGARS